MSLIVDNGDQVPFSGDIVVKDVVYSNDYHIVDSNISELSISKSNYVVDSPTDDVQEFSRFTYGVDSLKESGVISIKALRTDSSGTQNLPTIITTTPSSTKIVTTDDTGNVTATFGTDGLSFDSDTSSIFFGESSTFRIKYEPTAPARLLFQSLNTISGEYDTKYSIL